MPYPKSVTIDGTPIEEVQGVTVYVETPSNERGHYETRTRAATVQLLRRASNTPIVNMFKDATNGDGRLNIITGEIKLQNALMNETYTITMNQAFISEWHFTQPENDMLYEVITLKVGDLTLSGGGNPKSFKLPEFNLQHI